jgi:hypothetical protein
MQAEDAQLAMFSTWLIAQADAMPVVLARRQLNGVWRLNGPSIEAQIAKAVSMRPFPCAGSSALLSEVALSFRVDSDLRSVDHRLANTCAWG